MPHFSPIRHVVAASARAALLAAVGVALVFGLAVAGNHQPVGAGDAFAATGKAAIWVDSSSYTAATTQLVFGQDVTFDWRSDTAQSIQLHCYQPVGSDRLVFADSRMLYEGGWGYGVPFVLGPSASWTGGAATCTAMLGHRTNAGKYRVEATVTFDVAP